MGQPTPQELCEKLSGIIGFLENGNPASAAALVAELELLLVDLPTTVSDVEFDQVRGLVERYGILSEELRQTLVLAMNRMGAARRLRLYSTGQQVRGP